MEWQLLTYYVVLHSVFCLIVVSINFIINTNIQPDLISSRFYATSPRSPAVHYAIAKHLTIFNLLHIISSIVLAVDINSYGFNYSLTPATRNLLVIINLIIRTNFFVNISKLIHI